MYGLKEGLYEFLGNTVEYEGGEFGHDLDSREDVPADALAMMGEFIGTFEECGY